MNCIGIRREDKGVWERRAPLTPDDVAALKARYSVDIIVQPSDNRIFTNEAYAQAGAIIGEDLQRCPIILGIKEIPEDKYLAGKTYFLFSHTTKGQPHNMGKLARMVDKRVSLIDYEKVTDDQGARLIAFGRYAGQAGIINALAFFGKQHKLRGMETPFAQLKQALHYSSASDIKAAFAAVAEAMQPTHTNTITPPTPMIVAVTGRGRVAQGVDDYLSLLPFRPLSPADLLGPQAAQLLSTWPYWRVQYLRTDLYTEPKPGSGERIRSLFSASLPHISLLANCIYWDPSYPPLLSEADLKRLLTTAAPPKLALIADISCDYMGSIEATRRFTSQDNPVMTYTADGSLVDDIQLQGIGMITTDNLPAELPHDSSVHFSSLLTPFLQEVLANDLSTPYASWKLPPALRRATILVEGRFTKHYQYMEEFLPLDERSGMRAL